MNRLVLAVLTTLLLGGSLPQQAAAQNDDPYAEAVRIGVQEFGRGNYAESLAAMRRAHSIDPNARTLRGMGLAAFELGQYVDALDYLEASLTEERKPLTADMREQVEAIMRRAETNVATVVLRVTPQDARVRVDEGPPRPLNDRGVLRLNLGTHTVELRAKGHEPQRLRLQLVGGEKPELEVQLQPRQPSAPAMPPAPQRPQRDSKRIWGQVLIALASGAAAGSLVSLGLNRSAYNTYNSDACLPNRSQQCAEEADRFETTRAVAIPLGAAALAFGAAGTGLLWHSRRQARADRPAASLQCTPGLGVTCQLRF